MPSPTPKPWQEVLHAAGACSEACIKAINYDHPLDFWEAASYDDLDWAFIELINRKALPKNVVETIDMLLELAISDSNKARIIRSLIPNPIPHLFPKYKKFIPVALRRP